MSSPPDLALSQPFESPVKPGDLLAGKYRVDRVLGVGGMGVVVAARHEQLDQIVALKFVVGNTDAVVIERFLREAKAASRLRSEYVARVIDVGTLDTGAPFIVMEYLDGCDLSQVIRERGPLPIETAVDYILQACIGLSEAHTLGIIHRDLKPGNLFLTQRVDGRPIIKVLDFGISKTLTDGSPMSMAQLTRTNSAIGSPLYMAPEQMRSARTADARADIWALGVVLYELLNGTPPFTGSSLPEICLKAATEPAEPIRRNDVPVGLLAVVETCMQKDPTLRFPHVVELAAALTPWAPSGSTAAQSCQKIAIENRAKQDRTAEGFVSPATARIDISAFASHASGAGGNPPLSYTPSGSNPPLLRQTPSASQFPATQVPFSRTPPGVTPGAWMQPAPAAAPRPPAKKNALPVMLLVGAVSVLLVGGFMVSRMNRDSGDIGATSSGTATSASVPTPASASASASNAATTASATASTLTTPSASAMATLEPVASAAPHGSQPRGWPQPNGNQRTPTTVSSATATATAATPPKSHVDDDIPSMR